MAGAARAKKRPVISAEVIAEYIEVNQIYNKAKSKREKLRDKLVAAIEAGAVMDAGSPFRLFLLHVDKSAVDWRKVVEGIYQENYPEDWEKRIAKMETDQRRDEIHLKFEPNVPAADKLVMMEGQ